MRGVVIGLGYWVSVSEPNLIVLTC